jgi:nicotinate-nucleotide adenylyltransferase
VFTVPGRRGLEGLSPKHLVLSGKARAGPREHGASGKRRHPGQALKEASVASQRSAHEIPVHTDGMRIGLLGGSFNPPHLAHRAISLFAIKRLKLDRIWWLVTPGNPLKDNGALHELEERAAAARQMAGDPRIDVTCLESVIGTRYTIDTITYLRRRASGLRFVWIMGADNLAQLHRWQHWRRITTQVPIAVIDRPPQSFRALRAPAAQALARYRLPENEASRLAGHRPPAWVFLTGLKLNLSSTGLRNPDGSWKIGK